LKRSLSIFLLFLITLQALSQGKVISASILDNKGQPLIGASAVLLHLPDSSFYKGATADIDGKFSIPDVSPASYALRFSFIGFRDIVRNVKISAEDLSLGTITMTESSTVLKDVTITDKAPTAVQKGDTTQYNASSYKTNPDANAEDLVTKMSGVTTQDGKVQAQGEDVKKVLVDGKPFFGDDPNAVLKNLPADVIDKIQVFDQQSEQSKFTGVSDGNTTKTINIITKQGMKNGTFGRIYAGYGYDNVYRSGVNLNFFNGDRRLSVIAQSNNINEQNFSSEDLAGVMSSSGNSGGGGRRGGGGMGGPGYNNNNSSSNFLVNAKNGISTTHAFGLNYTDKWNKKTEFSGSYFLNYADNVADQNIFRQYLNSSDSGQTYTEENIARSMNTNHRVNLKLEWKPDTNNTLTIKPKFSLQDNDGNSSVYGQTIAGDALLGSTSNEYSSEVVSYALSNETEYMHKFRKQGRTFSTTLNLYYNATDANSMLYANNFFQQDSSSVTEIIDQKSVLYKNGSGGNINVAYTEPLSKKSILQLQYIGTLSLNDNDKRTFDFSPLENGYSNQNELLSNVFSSEYIAHKSGLTYRYSNQKTNFHVGVNYQQASLSAEREYPGAYRLQKNFEDVLPTAMLRYSFSSKKNIRIMYRTQTTQPSIEQMQDVLNNTNPLQLSKGNSDLRQNYEHTLFSRYSSSNTEKATSFFFMIAGGRTSDYISNSTYTASTDTMINGVYLQKGAQLVMPVNLDGYQNLRSFLTYGLPLSKLRSNLNISLNASYTKTPGLINDEINYARVQNYGGGLTLSSNISKDVDFTISSNTSYSLTENSLNKKLNTTYLNQTSKVKLNLIFLKQMVFSSDLAHQYYSGLSEGFNQNFLLWNAALGYKFLKDNKAEIRLSVNDILGQNQSISRNITETYIEDVQTTVLQRYFMLTFTYNIKVFRSKSQE
jgi:hypothetical protein